MREHGRVERREPHAFLLRIAFAVLVFGGAALTASAFARQSPTVDEPTHLVRGLSYWWTGDTKLSYAHPPLANAIAAIPGAIRDRDAHLPLQKLNGWKDSNPGKVTIAVAGRDYEKLRGEWLLGRYAMLAVSMAFLAYLFRWSERRFGGLVALGGVGLLAIDPTFWAHASLVTTDGMMVALFTVALCELVGALESKTRLGAVRFGVALGAALLAKFSAIILLPLAGVVVLGAAAFGLAPRFRGAPRRARLGRLVLDVTLVAVIACTMVNAGYRFQRTCWTVDRILAEPEPQNNISNDYQSDLLEKRTPLASLPKGLIVPLPYAYVFGVSTIKVQTTGGHPLTSYFLGEIRRDGVPYYFPLLLLLKTPLVVWAAIAGGIVVAVRRRAWAVLLPAALACAFLLSITTSGLNIGVRHALPVLPAFALVGGFGVAALLARLPASPVRLSPALAVIALGVLASSRGDFLGYFNPLAGDEDNQRHVSVVGEDWGQDAQALGRYARAKRVHEIAFVGIGHTGTRELTRLGIASQKYGCSRPKGTRWVAVHDSKIVRSKGCYRWLPKEPTAWIDNHIRVYDLGTPKG